MMQLPCDDGGIGALQQGVLKKDLLEMLIEKLDEEGNLKEDPPEKKPRVYIEDDAADEEEDDGAQEEEEDEEYDPVSDVSGAEHDDDDTIWCDCSSLEVAFAVTACSAGKRTFDLHAVGSILCVVEGVCSPPHESAIIEILAGMCVHMSGNKRSVLQGSGNRTGARA